MTEKTQEGIDRRTFVKQAGVAALAVGMDARSYARVLGANDRIRLGQLGCGQRSGGHVHMAQLASKHMPVETVAVCDIWTLAREQRAAQVKKAFNLDPQMFKYSEEMLARPDIDGVMIATGDFQHAKLCVEVVRAGQGLLRREAVCECAVGSQGSARCCEGVEASGSDGIAASHPALPTCRSGYRPLRSTRQDRPH